MCVCLTNIYYLIVCSVLFALFCFFVIPPPAFFPCPLSKKKENELKACVEDLTRRERELSKDRTRLEEGDAKLQKQQMQWKEKAQLKTDEIESLQKHFRLHGQHVQSKVFFFFIRVHLFFLVLSLSCRQKVKKGSSSFSHISSPSL